MFTFPVLLSLWANLIASGFSALNPAVATDGTKTSKKESTVTIGEQLSWSTDRRLSWDDFRAVPDAANPHHALTAANLAVNGKCVNNTFVYEVRCVFLPTESWTKNKKSAKLLYHEQLHFDLTEVHARTLRKNLKSIGASCTTVKDKMNLTVAAAFKDWKAEQEKFDKLSNHGLDLEAQTALEENIIARLTALEAYK